MRITDSLGIHPVLFIYWDNSVSVPVKKQTCRSNLKLLKFDRAQFLGGSKIRLFMFIKLNISNRKKVVAKTSKQAVSK
jgi:hypothetical protein